MADIRTRKTALAADLIELRVYLDSARTALKSLPAPASRNANQRALARNERFMLLLGRIVLNALSTPTDDDLDQTGATQTPGNP